VREDLAALTPESVVALANLGLVKRAQREIEQGKGPRIEESDDGTVVGTFSEDGAIAMLPRGRALRDCLCTCGALDVCRHRVAVALAYPGWAASQPDAAPAAAADPARSSPGEIDDAELAAALGPRTLAEARAARRRGLVIEVWRATEREAHPIAMLPSCTVRFLVPGDLAYARCDCREGHGCAHVALAVWAFREADARGRDRRSLAVDVREDADQAIAAGSLDPALELSRALLVDGVVTAREALAQSFAVARAALEESGDVWPASLLEELESGLSLYRSRSARYRASDIARAIVELEARSRASRGRGELPARAILGRGEVLETRLDHLSLIGLGARLDADARSREARILLADSDAGTILVLTVEWRFAEGETIPDGPALGRRRIGALGTLAALASGRIATKAAIRRANRALRFATSTSAASSSAITAQSGAWDALPASISVPGIASLAESLAARPPRALRPRVLAEDVRAIPIGSIHSIAWDPAHQSLIAVAHDRDGQPFRIVRSHRALAPSAIDALAAALGGAWGAPRFVVGEVCRTLGEIEIDPTAIACDRVIVPDLEADPPPSSLPLARPRPPEPPLERALARAAGLLEELAHLGLRGAPASWTERAREHAPSLEAVGLGEIARRLRALELALRAARGGSDESAWRSAACSWVECALPLELAREML
jgi:hypothetical protein